MGEHTSRAAPRITVCGIGASAGGVGALQHFFRALPPDLGLAYIVVIHLSPDHPSELPSILARWTTMPVVQVADHDHTKLAPDHVYVIAPDRKLEITDSSVAASPFTQPRGHRTAIDLFFRSLAAEHGDGFAVVLSGGGSDGAVGAKAVRERGGLVLVQDPREAAHGDMPRATIAAGVADLVLPVSDLVTRLAELARIKDRLDPALRSPEPVPTIPDDEAAALRQVLDLLRIRTGHDFSGYKRGTVLRRLSRRMQLSDRLTIRDYLTFVQNNAAEAQALFDDLLISVTTFFRDPEAWETLRKHVIAPLAAQTPVNDPIRVWAPGCATGEEAYTLAILFHEEFERQQHSRELIIFASDMDPAALAIARDGIYPQAIRTDVSDRRLERFFLHDGDHYRVIPAVRDHVVFAAHNLLSDPPFSHLHLISCRNVLIYLDRDCHSQVMDIFRYACGNGGFLMLGSAEAADADLFEPVDVRHRIYRARPDAQVATPALSDLASHRVSGRRTSGERAAAPMPAASDVHAEALEAMAPPTALLDERWNVLHLSSTASRFLQQGAGPLARRATDLIRSELRQSLHALLLRVSEESAPRVSPSVVVQFDDGARRVALLAQQRTRANGARDMLLTFLDLGEVATTPAGPPAPADMTITALSTKLLDAEQRIENMREESILATEEMRATNEELQSLNEEYRSTTEELETSKEELQSTNEELQTVNQELKLKLDELSQTHNDLENLMAATNVATLFLNLDLRITWYTRQLTELFTIKPRDLDRPIGDLRHTLDYADFESDARQVLATLSPIERQTTSQQGLVYMARLSPYRTGSGRAADGVAVTFVDVTALKQAEAALRDSQQQLEIELAVLRRLHAITKGVATAPNLSDALAHLVTAAVDLHGADQGHVLLHDRDGQRLQLVAHHGCAAPFLARFATMALDDPSSFAEVLRTREITQIADVTEHETDASLRHLATEAGYRAVQSTPLINRDGELLGVLSIHFRDRHRFTERDLQLSALLGRQTAELLEAQIYQLEVSASKVETSDVRKLLGRLVMVQEEERRRMAMDVHDQMGQPMTALRMQIEALQTRCEAYPELAPEIGRTVDLAEELDQSIDFLTWQLRPAALEHLGVSAALSDLVRGWSERFHISADYHGDGVRDTDLPGDVSVNLYRIVQEGLHNVQKHARATHVSVLLAIRDADVVLVIEDDGQGFAEDEHDPTQRRGLGLVSMRERARLIGGEFTIETAPRQGTSIFVRVPYADNVTGDVVE